MLKALYNYFVQTSPRVSESDRGIRWERVSPWTYVAIAIFTFGHIWVNDASADRWGCPRNFNGIPTVEMCGRAANTMIGAALGATLWPLYASIQLHEKLAGEE